MTFPHKGFNPFLVNVLRKSMFMTCLLMPARPNFGGYWVILHAKEVGSEFLQAGINFPFIYPQRCLQFPFRFLEASSIFSGDFCTQLVYLPNRCRTGCIKCAACTTSIIFAQVMLCHKIGFLWIMTEFWISFDFFFEN